MGSVVAELTFRQEIAKALVEAAATAVATAILVTVAGTLIAGRWSKRRDERRERFEVRSDMLQNCTRVASTMYLACQHARRSLNQVGKDELKREPILDELHAAYRLFAVDSKVLEDLVGARYGFVESLDAGPEVSSGQPGRRAWERWHQVADLLTLYYFNVAGMRHDVLEANSRDPGKRYHSGLNLLFFQHKLDDPEALSDMRKQIRRTYETAMRDLVHRIMADKLTLDA